MKSAKIVRKMWIDTVRSDGLEEEWETVTSEIKPVQKAQIFSIQNAVVLYERHSTQRPC